MQIYFDFSGYSEMAVGIGLMFGVRLPWNFETPYQSASIIQFWRRWHMTLSRFLRDYLYIPLGGSRRGRLRRYLNLLVTMSLGGLWHGAAWAFVAWGALHGFYLMINHAWVRWGIPLPRPVAAGLTFIAVLLSWVLFRADHLDDAVHIWGAMLGLSAPFSGAGLPDVATGFALAVALCVAIFAPSARRLTERFDGQVAFAVMTAALAAAALIKQLYSGDVHQFIYFQF